MNRPPERTPATCAKHGEPLPGCEFCESQRLTFGQAVALLPDGDRVHTFVNPAGMLVGADWDRDKILDLLRTGEPELAGDQATAMKHGLVAFRDGDPGQPVFIETKAAGDE